MPLYGQSDGYHNDPFKIVSHVDDSPGANLGEPIDHIYENRPDSRAKTAFSWKTKHAFNRDVIDVSYRTLSDDWGVTSHTDVAPGTRTPGNAQTLCEKRKPAQGSGICGRICLLIPT